MRWKFLTTGVDDTSSSDWMKIAWWSLSLSCVAKMASIEGEKCA